MTHSSNYAIVEWHLGKSSLLSLRYAQEVVRAYLLRSVDISLGIQPFVVGSSRLFGVTSESILNFFRMDILRYKFQSG